MRTLEIEYRSSGRSWQAIMGGAALTVLVLCAIASTRISSSFMAKSRDEAVEIYYKPPPAPPAIKQAPLPKSSHSEKSFSFDFALREDPVDIELKTLDVKLGHDLGASASLKLELDRKFEARRPEIGDLSEFMIYENTEVDSKPYPTYSPDPNIPYNLRSNEVEVVMFYFVSDKGRSDRITVLNSTSDDPLYSEAAKVAIAKWRFRPAKKNGKPVNCWVQQTIKYQRGSHSPFSL